jgi:hypothetical protein
MRALRAVALGVVAVVTLGSGATLAGAATRPVSARPAASVSTSEWGSEFCATIVDWRDEMASLQAEHQPRIESAGSPQATLDALAAFLHAAADATDDAAARQADAGKPRVKHGAKIEATFVAAYRGIAEVLRANARRAERLDATDPAVSAQIRRIQARVEAAKDDFGDATDAVKKLDRKQKLSRRLEALPACAALSG